MLMTARRVITVVLLAFAMCPAATAARADEPKDANGYLERGRLWYQKAEWDKAINDFTEVIRLDPKSSAAVERRATARLQLGEWDKAINDFDEAIRLNPRLASAFSNRGVAWQWKGDLGKAMADYTEAIRLNPKYAPAFRNRGMIWKARGELDKAVTDYTEAIRLDPKYEDAFLSRGNVWTKKHDYEMALKDYDEAIAINPKSLNGLYNRAWLLATCPEVKFRDGVKAVRDAQSAYELPGKKLPQQLEMLAAAHAEAGNYVEAVKWQQKALEDVAYAKAQGESARERLKLYEAKKPYRDSPSADKRCGE
jgi:Tfp pilus assembly protein PilF